MDDAEIKEIWREVYDKTNLMEDLENNPMFKEGYKWGREATKEQVKDMLGTARVDLSPFSIGLVRGAEQAALERAAQKEKAEKSAPAVEPAKDYLEGRTEEEDAAHIAAILEKDAPKPASEPPKDIRNW